jgi:hypothetical protein
LGDERWCGRGFSSPAAISGGLTSRVRAGGAERTQDLRQGQRLDIWEEIHLHGEGGQDLLFADEAHCPCHLAKFLPVEAALERCEHRVNGRRGEHLKIDEDFP